MFLIYLLFVLIALIGLISAGLIVGTWVAYAIIKLFKLGDKGIDKNS